MKRRENRPAGISEAVGKLLEGVEDLPPAEMADVLGRAIALMQSARDAALGIVGQTECLESVEASMSKALRDARRVSDPGARREPGGRGYAALMLEPHIPQFREWLSAGVGLATIQRAVEMSGIQVTYASLVHFVQQKMPRDYRMYVERKEKYIPPVDVPFETESLRPGLEKVMAGRSTPPIPGRRGYVDAMLDAQKPVLRSWLHQGHSLNDILSMLAAVGVQMSYQSLRNYSKEAMPTEYARNMTIAKHSPEPSARHPWGSAEHELASEARCEP